MNTPSNKLRPQETYRQALLQRLSALTPERVLEVGCGGGGFLRSARGTGPTLFGIDPDEDAVQALGEEGFEVSRGQAQQLAFPDQAMDVVVFSYSAHHIEDWQRALEEALRVARRAVLILDPWYDKRLPCQRVARTFDVWCKQIDRECGMVHNDCLDAADLVGATDRQHGFVPDQRFLPARVAAVGTGPIEGMGRRTRPGSPLQPGLASTARSHNRGSDQRWVQRRWCHLAWHHPAVCC